MSVHSAQKIEQISRAANPKKGILEAVGDVSGVDVLTDLVLVGTFIRSEKRASGLLLPKEHLQEDEFQGKVGLVLKTGPLAYADWEDDSSRGKNATLHTWVVFAIKDTWPIQVNGVACRVVPYDKLRMRLNEPTMVF